LALHRFTVLLALAAVACNASAASDAAGGYRLAGIIAAGTGHVGLLELPQGGQVLVRVGSSLPDGARVLSLTDRELALQLHDGRRLQLVLSGLAGGSAVSAARSAEAPAAQEAAQEMVKTRSREPSYALLTVSVAPFREALRAPAADGTTTTKPSDAVVVQRFSSLLALPSGARILAVNDKPVATAAAAVNLTDRALAEGRMAILNVQSDSYQGVQRIYLQPATTRPKR
jgi:hypothetical protein